MSQPETTIIKVGEIRNYGSTSIYVQPPLDDAEVAHLGHLGYAPSSLQPGERWVPALNLDIHPHFVEQVTGESDTPASRITISRYDNHNADRHRERVQLIAYGISNTLRDLRGSEVIVDHGAADVSEGVSISILARALECAIGDPRQTTVEINTNSGNIRQS